MVRIAFALLFAGSVCSVAQAAGSGTGVLNWAELVDASAQTYDDPFLDLSPDQLSRLATIARLRERLFQPETGEEGRKRIAADLDNKERALREEGVDIDALLELRWVVADRRKKAANAANPAIDGKVVEIAGFTIPVAGEEDGERFAYLVPERGMCSHVPPPDPNQMIRINDPKKLLPDGNYVPVKVRGTLRVEPTVKRIFLIDGQRKMDAVFMMDLDDVETFNAADRTAPDAAPDAAAGGAWVENLKKRIRAGKEDGS